MSDNANRDMAERVSELTAGWPHLEEGKPMTEMNSDLCTCEKIEEFCEKSADGIHSHEWWDGVGPCQFCGSATCPACDPETGEHP